MESTTTTTHHHLFSKGRREEMEQELLRGREKANQLLEVLVVHKSKKKNNSEDSEDEGNLMILPFAEDLLHQVLRSFTNTLLLLNTNNDVFFDNHEVLPPFITSRDFSSSSTSCHNHHEDNMDMDMEACKSSFEAKSRRGCYKRKSTIPTWEKDSQILIEDGHAWRKYGQKKTSNSTYHRNYYRCTYKHDQGCQAIKHVQRIQDDPPLYRTTYYGHHSCKTTFNHHEIIMEPNDPTIFGSNSILLSFDKSIPKNEPLFSSSSSPTFESRKDQEHVEEAMMMIHNNNDPNIAYNNNQFSSSSSDYDILLCDNYEVGDFNYYSNHQASMVSSSDISVHQFDNNVYYGASLDFDGLDYCIGQQNYF